MKHSIKFSLLGGVLLFSLSMCLTSCEGALDDVLGEWSRPTPGNNTPSGGGSTINATALTLKQTMKVIKMGGATFTITTEVTPSDATVTWESEDPNIATVENGVVTPVGKGITTITAKSGDVKATCKVFVGTVVALGSGDYDANNYDILTGPITGSLTIPDGYKVAFDGVTASKTVTCSGDATIYLTDGEANTVNGDANQAGIKIGGDGTTLTIDAETAGTGTLDVTGNTGGAGIGTGYVNNASVTGGNIVINGGKITATGSNEAAGIGTGLSNSGASAASNQCGDITINGGTVTATGSDKAAGIGTGLSYVGASSASSNTCGAIKINGGTVTASGGANAAGIGTGYAEGSTNAKQICGAITITADVTSVTATKGTGSTNSIGVGAASGGSQACGKITFGTAEVFDGASPGTWDAGINFTTNGDYGPYGGLNLNISTTTNANDTWKLTPAP